LFFVFNSKKNPFLLVVSFSSFLQCLVVRVNSGPVVYYPDTRILVLEEKMKRNV